jgi:hypothetical protein
MFIVISTRGAYVYRSTETQLFFMCLDNQASSDQAKWLNGVLWNVERLAYKRSVP